jgi:hypothetical protein
MRALGRKTEAELLPPLRDASELGDTRFRRLLSPVEWNALPEAIRRRFSHRSAPGEAHVYIGRVLETRISAWGAILANLLRLIGSPLPLERNNEGAAGVVTVTERPDGAGQFWTREYVRRRGFPQVIHSSKMFSGATGIEETVGCGVTMSLRLDVRRNALFFLSERFFLRIGRFRLPIPGSLIVGHIAVGHIDRGNGAFEFTLEATHPLFGRFIRQRALFNDVELEHRAR